MLGRDLKKPLLGPAFRSSERHSASGTVQEGASQGPAVTTFKEKVKMEEKNLPTSISLRGFLGGSVVKSPAKQETWVRSLNWEDPLEKEMATHSNILASEIPWKDGPEGLYSP